jgi:poly-gamma-glutamate synthesis protein (capsule biosynthesis protein)
LFIKQRFEFKGKKHSGKTVKISAVGDLLLDDTLQRVAHQHMNKSIKDPNQRVASGYYHILEPMAKYISSADIAYANLEVPLARNLIRKSRYDETGRLITIEHRVDPYILHDGRAYCGEFPYTFNAHPAFAITMKKVGWDIVSIANNHVLDRLSNGLDLTIRTLQENNINFVGAIPYSKVREADGNPFNIKPYVIKEVKGIKIAFFAIARFTNPHFYRLIPSDRYHQVYKFTKSFFYGKSNVPKLLRWIKDAKENGNADIVIVAPHWGLEYVNYTNFLQRVWAHQLLEGGADIILGSHPHVIQPFEKYITSDGRETFIAYSLGNFVCGLKSFRLRAAFILYITLIKNNKGVFIRDISYLPTISKLYIKDGNIVDIKVIPIEQDEKAQKKLLYFENILGKETMVHPNF